MLGPLGPGPNPNVKACIFLQRPSNPNHNHAYFYNHECWAHWAQGPTLMYKHACFYNDPVTLITTMHISTSMSAGPFGPCILAGQKCTSVYIFSCAGPVFGAAKPGKTPWESLEKPPEKELGPSQAATQGDSPLRGPIKGFVLRILLTCWFICLIVGFVFRFLTVF